MRFVSLRRGDVKWPARASLDLNICNSFLCGYPRENAFKHRPQALEELKVGIREGIAAIDACKNAIENFQNPAFQIYHC